MDTSNAPRNSRRPAKERTFLSCAGHELRTPLHSANGFVEMVLDSVAGPLNERQREMLGYAHTAIGQLTTLVDEVLFLARADNGEIRLRQASVHPAAVLARAIESVRERIAEKSISLALNSDELPVTIQVDSERLREGLVGLLRGALALLPHGGTMSVGVSTRDSLVSFTVSLASVRLDATDLRHLFERFYQPQPLDADRAANPGLGLAIAQVTAEWHGGTTRAEAIPDGSLILSYELPLLHPE